MKPTRRNGQLPSCEPCRKSKLRCDHTKPVCGRCTRRAREHLCIYHPAPLTRFTPGSIPVNQCSNSTAPPAEERQGSWSYKNASLNLGYLGHTSYSDAYNDNAGDLGMEFPSYTTTTIRVDEHNIKSGAQALLMLKDLPRFRSLLSARYKMYDGYTLGGPMAYMVLNGAEEMWNKMKEKEPDEEKCALRMSRQLFEKTTQTFTITSDMSWDDFAKEAYGRWESIGLLLTLVGHSTGAYDYPKTNWSDPQGLGVAAAGVGDLCLQFCDSAGVSNDVVCLLKLYHTTLLSVVYGDWDYRPWRKLGEITTSLYALGMHQESPHLPFFLREIRRRTMASAYTLDKALASFLGRPPLISWRFCSFDMPLDLNLEEVVAKPSRRDAAIAKLDQDGWNKGGHLNKGSGVRGFLLISIGREKIMELYLSNQTDGLMERVENLSRELSRQYREIPKFLQWEHRSENKESLIGYRLVQDLYLEFLYNDFLLHRILAKRIQTQSERGIAISLEILTALISIISWTHQNHAMGWDASWNLCNAGIPSAGVLCAELLRRSRHPTPEVDDFPRSDIIQKLSIFASHLETMIRPNEGNYQIAQQGHRAIRHVLDRVLAAPIPAAAPGFAATPVSGPDMDDPDTLCPGILDNIDIDDRVQFLDWLDGRAESHEPWLTWTNFG